MWPSFVRPPEPYTIHTPWRGTWRPRVQTSCNCRPCMWSGLFHGRHDCSRSWRWHSPAGAAALVLVPRWGATRTGFFHADPWSAFFKKIRQPSSRHGLVPFSRPFLPWWGELSILCPNPGRISLLRWLFNHNPHGTEIGSLHAPGQAIRRARYPWRGRLQRIHDPVLSLRRRRSNRATSLHQGITPSASPIPPTGFMGAAFRPAPCPSRIPGQFNRLRG